MHSAAPPCRTAMSTLSHAVVKILAARRDCTLREQDCAERRRSVWSESKLGQIDARVHTDPLKDVANQSDSALVSWLAGDSASELFRPLGGQNDE